MSTGPSGTAATPAPVVIDASVWVSFLIASDANHLASFSWIDGHTRAGGILVAPSILLTEVAAAISRRLNQPQLALHLANSLQTQSFMRITQMDASLVTDATQIAANFGLRAADAIYVVVARQLSITLLTWDREQLTRPASIINSATP